MKIDNLTPEHAILEELGSRLATIRKQKGFSQTRLAEAAGIGVATLRRIEAGNDSQMESWLKLLKPLDMLAAVDLLLPENYRSPMAEVKTANKKHSGKQTPTGWGDEQLSGKAQ
ncbi:MAG: transcriptional regulator [Granulosicoccaceae bacterium]